MKRQGGNSNDNSIDTSPVGGARVERFDLVEGARVELKRELNLYHGVAIIMGMVIGSGIYLAPKGVFLQVPSAGVVLLLWVVGAVIAILGALTFAELGTTIPRAGCRYAYLDEAFGSFPAFLHLWQYLLMARPAANVGKCIVFGQYFIKPFFKGCDIPESAVIIIAFLVAGTVTVINSQRVVSSGKFQIFCTSMTVLALLIIITIGAIHIGKGETEHFHQPFAGASDTDLGSLALGIYYTKLAYGGWFALNFMVEELKDPFRTLPLAIFISISMIAVLYLTVNVAYIAVLGIEGIIKSEAVAISVAEQTLGPLAWIISLMICINTSGSLNSGVLVASRLAYAGARRGHLPNVLSMIHLEKRSPVPALALQLLSMIILGCTADLYTLLNNLIFINTFFDALTAYGLLYLRWKKPTLPRPIKLPLVVPVLYAGIESLLVIVPLVTKPSATAMGMLVILVTGVPYYLVFVLKLVNMSRFNKQYIKLTIVLQKIFMCVEQEDQ